MDAAGSCLRSYGMAHPPAQFRLERTCQTDLLREAGGIAVKKSVERFLAEEKRNPQGGLLHCLTLQFVGKLGRGGAELDAPHASSV